MSSSRFALIAVLLGLMLAACDVKKAPESASVAAPESPRVTAPESAAPAAPRPELPASAPAASTPGPAASTPEPPASTPEPPASTPEPPASETNPGANPSPACEAQKDALKARFVEAARCGSDAECEAIQPGCPFGCGLAVNRSTDIGRLKRDIAAFKTECNDCVYRCRPPSGPPVCRAGACSFSARAAK